MKEIIVNEANMSKIEAVINEVQGRSTERLITSDNIVKELDTVEKKLGITKKAMEGIQVDIDVHAQDFPKAYKWTPMSTRFCATYRGGKWRVTDIGRHACRKWGKNIIVKHTEDSQKAIMEKFTIMKDW